MAKRKIRDLFAVVHDEDSEHNELMETYRQLRRMRDRYVLPIEYYPLLVAVVERLGLGSNTALTDLEEGIVRYPDEPILLQILGTAYTRNGYPLLGRTLLRRLLEISPESDWFDGGYIRHLVEDVEAIVPEMIRETSLEWPADEDIAFATEHIRRNTETGRFEDGIREARQLLEERPELNYVRNNLARALWECGRLDEAITEQSESLRRVPIRLIGLSNMVRFCFLTDREAEAYRWRDHAYAIEPSSPGDLHARLEIAAFCRDDGEILRLAKELKKREKSRDHFRAGTFGPAALICGTACARTGDLSGARRWWDSALGVEETRGSAQFRLEELDRPDDDRNEPWYFDFVELIPRRIFDRTMSAEQETRSDYDHVRLIHDEFPQLTASVRYLLRAGDDTSRSFGLLMAEQIESGDVLEEVGRLVFRNALRTERKIQAKQFLAGRGETVVEAETPEGPQRRVFSFREFEISREPTENAPPEVKDLSERTTCSDKADKAAEILEKTYACFPDYFFARCGIAVRMAREEGRIKEAHELLQPILDRRKFHISEFTTLCHTMVLILIADQNFDAAVEWLDMWKEAEPDDSRLENFSMLEGYRALNTLIRDSGKEAPRKRRYSDTDGQLSLF